jgi:hypothetical protein
VRAQVIEPHLNVAGSNQADAVNLLLIIILKQLELAGGQDTKTERRGVLFIDERRRHPSAVPITFVAIAMLSLGPADYLSEPHYGNNDSSRLNADSEWILLGGAEAGY